MRHFRLEKKNSLHSMYIGDVYNVLYITYFVVHLLSL